MLRKLPTTAILAPLALLLLWGCEPVAQPAHASVAVTDSDTPSVGAFLIYVHGDVPDTISEGGVGQAIQPLIDLHLDLGGKVAIESARNHFQVEPAAALVGSVGWSEHLGKLFFRLRGLEPGQEITITVRNGLERDGLEPLARDHVWRLRGVKPTEVQLSLSGPRLLRYSGTEYQPFSGVVRDSSGVFVIPADSLTLELRFSRAANVATVEAVLRGELQDAEFQLHWPAPDRSGRVLERVTGISLLERGELWDEALDPAWLPDGRIAFLRRVERSAARELAIVDPRSGAIETTEQTPRRILDVSPDGVLLFEENELYELGTRKRTQLAMTDGSHNPLRAFSPDGQWIAGMDYREGLEIGVLRREDGSWHRVGRGRLVGWSPEGSLYWIGPPPDAQR